MAGKLGNTKCHRVRIALQIDGDSAWSKDGFFDSGHTQLDFGIVKRWKFLDDFNTATARGVAARELDDSPATDCGGVEKVQDKAIPQ
jgi:hypothetical protein